MVKRRTRTELTVETDELWIIRRRGRLSPASCSQCGEHGPMITLEEAVALAGVSSRSIHRWAEAGEIHFTETPEGLLLVCLEALLRSADKQSRRMTQPLLRSDS